MYHTELYLEELELPTPDQELDWAIANEHSLDNDEDPDFLEDEELYAGGEW